MIENLNGLRETVNFKDNTNIRMYDNTDYEAYPPHWHIPIEIIMPLVNHYTVDCSAKSFDLREGDILIIGPGTIHTLHATPGERIIFQARFSIFQELKELDSVLSLISPVQIFTPENSPLIYDQLQGALLEIGKTYIKDQPLSEAYIFAKLAEMLVLIGRNHTDNMERFDVGEAKQREYADKFLYICHYIIDHCTEDLSLDDVAAEAGFSKYHFSRLFKQFTDISFYKYLNQKRIAVAENLLLDPSITITDAALRSGFSSLSAFIRMFKIIKNCTPTEFRNMYSNTLGEDRE